MVGVADATLVDVAGATVLPGLVDTHVHTTASEAPPWRVKLPDPGHNLEAWLYAGITTVFDMGGDTADVHKLQGEVESALGDADGSRRCLNPSGFECRHQVLETGSLFAT
mgnify:CR=1 FL=1